MQGDCARCAGPSEKKRIVEWGGSHNQETRDNLTESQRRDAINYHLSHPPKYLPKPGKNAPVDAADVRAVILSGLSVRLPPRFGACWLGESGGGEELELDEFSAKAFQD
jgi:hypothetical protein